MIKFLRRYFMFGVAVLIGGGGVIASYMHVTPTLPTHAYPQSTLARVQPEFRASSTLVRVNWITGPMNYQGDEVVGLSKYIYDEELNASICEIWIPMPKLVHGDEAMDTVGHELLHCLTGGFHQ